MKLFRIKNSQLMRNMRMILIICFLSLIPNVTMSSLHFHVHAEDNIIEKEGGHHSCAHRHQDEHAAHESHDDTNSEKEDSDCHYCHIIAAFNASPVIFQADHTPLTFKKYITALHQITFINTPVLKEYSHGPPKLI